jgi:N,N'-diacetyllegionaminate synthase
MSKSKPYIYTETAFHHQGDILYLKKLIETTKESGANGIKFQIILDLNYLTSTKHTAFNTLKTFVFNEIQWLEILNYASSLYLDIIFMPLDLLSFNLIDLMKIKPKYLEIHPVCFYDKEIIRLIKKSKLPTIVGIGGRDEFEIETMTNELNNQLEVLMVGFQSFPSKLEDVKIARIAYYKNKYPNLTIGYADHSAFNDEYAISSNDYAYLLGARIFEKHFTITEGENRVDYDSAVSKDKLIKIINNLNTLHNITTINETELLELDIPEINYRNRQKVIVANRVIEEGEIISENDITLRMINKENGMVNFNNIIGKTTTEKIDNDDIITLDKIK